MANRNIYYYKINLFSRDGKRQCNYRLLQDILKKMIEDPTISKTNGNAKIIDLTATSETLHTTIDIFRYKKDYLFMRTSRQKPTATMISREYATGKASDVLQGVSEDTKGIEKYTYVTVDYTDGILSMLGAQGAPDQGILVALFDRYSDKYDVELQAIPNINGIQKIYKKEKTEISEINLTIPVSNPVLLENLLGRKGRQLFEDMARDSLQTTIKITSATKNGKLTYNSDDSEKLLDCIQDKVDNYEKASVRARYEGCKTQTYNFGDNMFSFSVPINTTHIVEGNTVYYSECEYMTRCIEAMRYAYNENRDYIRLAANRMDSE